MIMNKHPTPDGFWHKIHDYGNGSQKKERPQWQRTDRAEEWKCRRAD